MKGKDLIDMIENSILKEDVEKKALYEKYFPVIEMGIKCGLNDVALDDLPSLEDMKDRNRKINFDNFIRDKDCKTVEDRLKEIIWDIKQLARAKDTKEQYISKTHHKRSIIRKIVLTGLGVITALLVIFTFLEKFEIVNTNDIFSATCGALDFFFGVSFFIYEVVSDGAEKQAREEFEALGSINATNVYYKSKFSNIKAPNGGIINFGVMTNVSDNADGEKSDFRDKTNAYIGKYARKK